MLHVGRMPLIIWTSEDEGETETEERAVNVLLRDGNDLPPFPTVSTTVFVLF